MNVRSIIIPVILGFIFAINSNGQTPVIFAKGTTEKTMTITVKPKDMNTYSLYVRSGQVINVSVTGDVAISRSNQFPVIGINLTNGVEDIDQWQDGEQYLSVLAGRDGKFVISINNSDRKRARTFKIKFSVTNDRQDYQGGESTN